ncbi:RNA recognition motif domain-containing protein [Falsiporphyromonas endometrii]|uniref:RNA recognition motif domain-containing protein n=1 Tax=Falsiporphyromonas endometrii TaxID=1387297 RepID=A0ABV9K4Z9_9PORP|nr:RNA-binding protein [Porphyromonadaceae bacterium]
MNIFVSNINYRTLEESLLDLFAAFGEVSSARIITDRETGRSRGFGFVEMENDAEAQSAINELDGKEFEGKELRVSVARPREPRNNFSRGGRRQDRY